MEIRKGYVTIVQTAKMQAKYVKLQRWRGKINLLCNNKKRTSHDVLF